MIDKRTTEEINKIAASVDTKGVVKEEKPEEIEFETREKAEWLEKKLSQSTGNQFSMAQQDRIREQINKIKAAVNPQSSFRVDDKRWAEADRELGAKIRKAIDTKRIPPAKRDEFVSYMKRKMGR